MDKKSKISFAWYVIFINISTYLNISRLINTAMEHV